MKLSEELIWRGFCAENTLETPEELDNRESKKFYFGADPSADSLTIGNLAAMMMCACFVRHGYEPTLLVGGATGQIGDPKETGERDLKPLEEVEFNKNCIKNQMSRVIKSDSLEMVDNLDWFKNINYLSFLREIGITFSMTQLLDRQFIQARIGVGGSGISYAEFSYTLIQGYDFLHLFREKGISLQLCGADQFGNASTGIHLIKRLENVRADVWSTPLIIDPVSGRKFGKSEGNAVWLASKPATKPNGEKSENFTSIFDFYQFWLNQPDESVEYLIKIYTVLDRPEIENILAEHKSSPELRLAQKALAKGATEVVHGASAASAAEFATNLLFSKDKTALKSLTSADFEKLSSVLGEVSLAENPDLLSALVASKLASSKSEARKLVKSGAISVNGEKISDETLVLKEPSLLKRGKNTYVIVE
ncbi:tyrosine--tRNA ligase [Candidatus Saccharibacteria bacterium]|nr:tyrosine--tRNA ligase [Candidatus Saccharibacteria bacterium]